MDELQEQKSWWKRNWKWVVPTGGCLTIIIVIACFVGYGVYKVTSELSENTSVFTFVKVITEVQKNEEIADALGKPVRIEDDDYDPTLAENHLELALDLEGSKASGTLEVIADRTEEGWEYSKFEVTVDDTGQLIDLLDTIND